MLRRIQIKNLAIVPEVAVSFDLGLNVLTGETGAGKSILVDAISLLAGGRASSEDVRSGEQTALVEGVLSVSSQSRVWKVLEEAGIKPSGEEILLRRNISSDGRSRAYVNDTPWTVGGLATLATEWLDVSAQHGQQQLLEEESHTDLIDVFGELQDQANHFTAQYNHWLALRHDLKQAIDQRRETEKQKEFLNFQFKELSEADVTDGEEEELKTRHRKLANAEQLASLIQQASDALDSEGGLNEQLGRLMALVRSAIKMDASLMPELSDFEEISSRVKEGSYRISHYARTLQFEPDELEKMNTRLALLQKLARKYGSLENMFSERSRIEALLSNLENADVREEEIKLKLEKTEAELQKAAEKLAKERKSAAKNFSSEVTTELRKLAMPEAQLHVKWFPYEGETLGPKGLETAQIFLAPNTGEGARPLSKIASGGELSRILLAIKSVALAKSRLRDITYLFDEVDSGIGGETAERVGIRLRALSEGRQVLCVTHLAQIACYASSHYRVEKRVKSGRTLAEVSLLSMADRAHELARMIGGIEITAKSKDHASELLARGQKNLSAAKPSKSKIPNEALTRV